MKTSDQREKAIADKLRSRVDALNTAICSAASAGIIVDI